ncbi:hypothetical protein OESDEN_09245 [Oesophagostomum dentatum]|uniref:Uncharacterized protein n=1 Tax=Oesophagostomum dentatum TaxID=61180 RepID=A0A0B1T028_OESDE|nr:hypothetical protein OESDEN_09245 [Oesophagostomum dentatum]
MTKMMQLDPAWIARRFVPEKATSNSVNVDNFTDVPEKTVLLETAEERRQAAELFGLLPPEEDESEVAGETSEFVLLPPDSSDED